MGVLIDPMTGMVMKRTKDPSDDPPPCFWGGQESGQRNPVRDTGGIGLPTRVDGAVEIIEKADTHRIRN